MMKKLCEFERDVGKFELYLTDDGEFLLRSEDGDEKAYITMLEKRSKGIKKKEYYIRAGRKMIHIPEQKARNWMYEAEKKKRMKYISPDEARERIQEIDRMIEEDRFDKEFTRLIYVNEDNQFCNDPYDAMEIWCVEREYIDSYIRANAEKIYVSGKQKTYTFYLLSDEILGYLNVRYKQQVKEKLLKEKEELLKKIQ